MFGQEKVEEKLEKNSHEVKKLKEEISLLKDSFLDHNKALKDIKHQLELLNSGQQNILISSQTSLKSIEDKGESFDRIIRKLDQTNLSLEQKTFSKINSTVEEELGKIKTDVSKYNSLKEELSVLTKNLDIIKSQLEKFNAIAVTIKQKDFELVNYAQKIENVEKEKYKVFQENEHLKDIMAKMAKGRNNYSNNNNFNKRPNYNNNPQRSNSNGFHSNVQNKPTPTENKQN
jgi:chromosome segregation ATPase